MIAALVVWGFVATLASLVFAVSSRFLGDRLREVNRQALDESQRLVGQVADERARADLVIAHERERHVAEIERLNAAHTVVLERLAHTIQYGTPTPQPAVVKDEEPDAESRLIHGISEDTVREGARRIQREYEKIGHVVSIEECEAEARALAFGVTPDIPPERLGLAALVDGPPPGAA